MKLLRQPIGYYVTFIVLSMGLLGLVLALGTGEFYRHLIMENQRAALARFGDLEVTGLMEELDRHARELGLSLQHHSAFRQAFRAQEIEVLDEMLESQFRQYFVTAGILKLERLQVFDRDLNPITRSDASGSAELGRVFCPTLIEHARSRQGPERLKPIGDLCRQGDRPLHAVLVPIGGLRLQGYLQVVTDPVHWLRRAESALNMPIRVRSPGGELLHRSESWEAQALQDRLMATSTVRSRMGHAVLYLDLASDTEALNRQLSEARYLVVTIAGLATLAMMVLALFIFRVTTVWPLRQLTERLRELRQDRSRLGEEITLVANAEVVELAEDFNEMTSELDELHTTLESLAYSDALTGLPNRVLFLDRLNHLIGLAQREHCSFALFMIDLNKFKPINDTLGHHAGDLLLAELGARMKAVLRCSDTVAYTGHTLARLGGDEFAILLPAIDDARGAARVAEKLASVLEEPFQLEGHTITVGMSVGAVLFPHHGTDAETLCRHADAAMYSAKRSGSGFALFEEASLPTGAAV